VQPPVNIGQEQLAGLVLFYERDKTLLRGNDPFLVLTTRCSAGKIAIPGRSLVTRPFRDVTPSRAMTYSDR